MQRREYLTNVAGLAALQTRSTQQSIDITIYETTSLANTSWTAKDSFYPASVAKTYLETAYSVFDAYTVNVSINTTPVSLPDDADPYTWWEDETVGMAGDCNLLLTAQYDEPYKGTAECFECDTPTERPWYGEDYSNCAVVNYATKLYETSNRYDLWKTNGDTAATELVAILHEVGHTLGLSHQHGFATYDSGGDTYNVTPMLATYALQPVDEQPPSYTGRERIHVPSDNHRFEMFLGDDVVDYVQTYGFNFEW